MQQKNATVAVVGAGDYIGSAIAERFAAEGYTVFAGRRNGDQLSPLKAKIEAAGGRCEARTLDARSEEAVTAFLTEADAHSPLEVCVFNVGANVNFSVTETTEARVPQGLGNGLLRGLPHRPRGGQADLARGAGSIFFTGATASMRGGKGYAAFPAPSSACAPWPQSMARELGPKNIHVAT